MLEAAPLPVLMAWWVHPALVTLAKQARPSLTTWQARLKLRPANPDKASPENVATRPSLMLTGLPSTVVSTAATNGVLPAAPNAKDLETANADLRLLVQRYARTAPALGQWLERNVPEGLAVFSLPEHHRLKMRTSNPIERSVQQEIKRRTIKVRVFPSTDALLRLVSAVLVEIDEKWAASTQPYIKWKADTVPTP